MGKASPEVEIHIHTEEDPLPLGSFNNYPLKQFEKGERDDCVEFIGLVLHLSSTLALFQAYVIERIVQYMDSAPIGRTGLKSTDHPEWSDHVHTYIQNLVQ